MPQLSCVYIFMFTWPLCAEGPNGLDVKFVAKTMAFNVVSIWIQERKHVINTSIMQFIPNTFGTSKGT